MTFGDFDLILTSHDTQMLFLCIGTKFAFDDLWWLWPDFDLPWYPNAFSMHRNSKIYLLKIWTWWPLVTLTWFGPPIMPKLLHLCIGTQKFIFWKFALNDLDLILTSHDAQMFFLYIGTKRCTFWKFALDDLDLILTSHDTQMFFLCIGTQEYNFWWICTWWPLVILTLHDTQMLFLCIVTQKYTFWTFALDDLWWPWLYFDFPWCPNAFSMHKNSKIHYLKICTWWPFIEIIEIVLE